MSQIVFDLAVDFLKSSEAHQLLLAGALCGFSKAEVDFCCQGFNQHLSEDQVETLQADGYFKFYILPLIGYGLMEESHGFYKVTQKGCWALQSAAQGVR